MSKQQTRHDAKDASTLERRLWDGWERIEQAQRRGEDVTAWEMFWIELLRQYEEAWDMLPEAER